MNYRPDIQILRGVSVLLVVIYHLRIGLFRSGFLGVDIFFVISGFLMAVLYNARSKADVLAPRVVIDFLSRRARRILPAYYVLLLLVLATGYFLLTPAEFGPLTYHTQYAALLIPNIGYWLEHNYFDRASFRPLLHLWTLGVEAQFYLIVPLIFAIYFRSKKLLIAIVLLSFIGCLFLASRSSNSAFFQLPARLWEFMIGFFCAQLLTQQGNVRRPMGWVSLCALGLLLIVASIDYTGIPRHPGLAATAACLLAAAILVFGLPDYLVRSPIGRLTEKVGQYSYSVYIVHFPIILFLKYKPLTGSNYKYQSIGELFLVSGLIIIASIAMYRLVESPMRRGTRHVSQLALLLVCVIVVIMAPPLLKQHQRSAYTQEQLSILDSAHDKTTFRCGVWYGLVTPLSQSCSLTSGDYDATRRYLLIGNSHADSIKTALAETALRYGYSLRIWKDNFSLGMAKTTPDNVLKEVMKYDIDVVIIHNSSGYFDLTETQKLVALAEQHGFNVALIEPVPTWHRNVPLLQWNERFEGETAKQQHLDAHYNKVSKDLAAIASVRSDAFTTFEVASHFCKPLCQKADRFGVPLYSDSGHLNLRGARILTPVFEKIFQM